MSGLQPAVEECAVRGEPALRLSSGELTATFLPGLGMNGVSLRHRGLEYLALPGGLPALRAGRTTGLPLLAPWANRLGGRRYRAAGVDVDLTDAPVHCDEHGLPIHGLLVGRPGWRVERRSAARATASIVASIDVDEPAFPFPHRVEVLIRPRDASLAIRTRVLATGSRAVPVAFGWHPYLRLPDARRRDWDLVLPSRTHLALDAHGLPTGGEEREPGERDRIGRRTFDDLYALGRTRRLGFAADDGTSITMRAGTGYPYAQVWVPAGRSFGALEPMTVATNSLVDGTTPLVEPGGDYTADFELRVGGA